MLSIDKINFQFISICFVAGCVGGLLNSLFVWSMAISGLNSALGIAVNPSLTAQWLYLRIVWAGLWGLLFCLPILTNTNIYKKALLYMLAPATVQLLIVFPLKLNKGLFGMQLGMLTPALILAANLVWAYSAAWWINHSQNSGHATTPQTA